MTQLIAAIFGYRITLRIICVLVAIFAAAYILYKHRVIPVKGHVVEKADASEKQLPENQQETLEATKPKIASMEFANGLRPCRCGRTPIYVEGYDTLSVQCPRCGRHTDTIYGDYYDEAFMLEIYKEQAADMWNRLED